MWLPKRFDRAAIPEVAGKFLNALRNTYAFFPALRAGRGARRAPAPAERPLVDRWLLSRLDATVEAVQGVGRVRRRPPVCAPSWTSWCDDLSQWYVRLNRARFWAPDAAADPRPLATLHEALTTVARLLAPAAPFASDWLHRALAGTSVHLARFPETLGQSAPRPGGRPWTRCAGWPPWRDHARRRRRSACGSRWAGCRWRCPPSARGAGFDALLELLRPEVNVKTVEVVASDTDLVRLRAKANFRTLGKRYGKRTPAVAAAAAPLAADQLRELEQGRSAELELEGERVTYLPEDVVVEREVASDWLVAATAPSSRRSIRRSTEPLRHEGLAREVVNRMQRLRKEAGYVYTDRIALWIEGAAAVLDAVRAHAEFIQGETLARSLDHRLPGARAGSGAAGGHRRTRCGGGSATTPGRPERSRPSTHGRGMNKKQLTHLEKRLLEERARVMKELGYYDESFNATLQSSDGDLSSYSFHMADQGTDAMEREKQFLFASQEGRYLWHVNEALRRLYGTPGQVRALPPVRPGDQLRAARRAAACAALHHLQGERGRWQAPLTQRRPGRSGGSSGSRRWP